MKKTKVGRPRLDQREKNPKVLPVRMTKKEYQTLKKESKFEGVSMAEFVRSLIKQLQ